MSFPLDVIDPVPMPSEQRAAPPAFGEFDVPSVTELFRRFHRPLLQFLRRCYPGVPSDWREDAVSSAFEVILLRPSMVYDAWRAGGASHVARRLQLIAWRQLRAINRKSWPLVAMPLPDLAGDTGMSRCDWISGRLEASLVRVARRVCAARHEALVAALVDRLTSGDGDAEVAARHQLRREYINRARRALAEELGLR